MTGCSLTLLMSLTLAYAQLEAPMSWHFRSSVLHDGERIPKQYTCEGPDVSPPLAWTEPPPGTKSLALTVDDPDAPRGMWVHWVLYNLLPQTQGLPEHVPKDITLLHGTLQGVNDFGQVGYGGPCPPPGASHRYVFALYALDEVVNLPPRATKAQLEQAMKGHLLAQARLSGLYQR